MVDEKKHPKAGTGDEFARFSLGALGELVIADDSYDDTDISIHVDLPDGTKTNLNSQVGSFRRENGDAALEAALKDAAELREQEFTSPSDYGVGIFVCDGCHKSWPQRRNQTPNGTADTCPDCV